MAKRDPSFSASEQSLGYMYQPRYALLQILRLPEETTCFLERDDDIDWSDPEEGKVLASLKHKAPGDVLTDLSPDFWKSVRIWLTHYLKDPRPSVSVSFFLMTTGAVVPGSVLECFLPNADRNKATPDRIKAILQESTSKTVQKTIELLSELPDEKWADFFRRITIFDHQERIQDIPKVITSEMLRTVRLQFRQAVYQRLEGWWIDECIKLLSGKRAESLRSSEVSEMLSSIAEQFREDNLPIDFQSASPKEGVNPNLDDRIFVEQLRCVGVNPERLKRAILDYYRAFEQRASWTREHVTLTGELEQYDERLVDEWSRRREIVFQELRDDSAEENMQSIGHKLFTELSLCDHEKLRIRSSVTATYVVMGSYHILANGDAPQVHWHPRFPDRIPELLKRRGT